MKKIGFIGTGNMGLPMLLGAVRAFGADQILYTDKSKMQQEKTEKETGIQPAEDNIALIQSCSYIVTAVKPQYLTSVYQDLRVAASEDTIIISPVAGVTITEIWKGIGRELRVIRLMPNTPAMVGEGMTAFCYSNHSFTKEHRSTAEALLASFGSFVELPEHLMNAAVCANGSSPAYIYMFIEALADSVVKYGIPRDTAYQLVAQTVLGAAKMVLETGEHPGKLKDNVCSPGGTTIAAVAALEEYGFRNAVFKATDACYAKTTKLN